MKSIYDILDSTPVKDTVTIRFNRPDLPGHIDEVHHVTEEQVRWLQYNIAIGEYPHDAACIMSPSGVKCEFAPDGRLIKSVEGSNIMSLNDDLAMQLLYAKAYKESKQAGIAEGIHYDDTPHYDEEYNDYDECEYPEDYDYPSDPMESAEAAFAYIDECLDDYYDGSLEELYDDFSEQQEKQQEDDEMSEFVNTPHDDMNVELKQIDKEIEDRKIDASIWHARETIMNKIVFSNGDSYPIHHISWEVDDNNIPVDIVISSRRKYLDYIAENHCQLGYNCNDEETNGLCEALYGRLDKFCVVDYEGKVILIS